MNSGKCRKSQNHTEEKKQGEGKWVQEKVNEKLTWHHDKITQDEFLLFKSRSWNESTWFTMSTCVLIWVCVVIWQAIFEIITSEHSYLHSLGILVRHFKNSEALRKTMTTTEHHHLFSNISVIHQVSQRWAQRSYRLTWVCMCVRGRWKTSCGECWPSCKKGSDDAISVWTVHRAVGLSV